MPPPKDPEKYKIWLENNRKSHIGKSTGKRPPRTEQWKEKQRIAQSGKTASEATRKKMSESRMGNKNSLGNKASEETKKKMSDKKKSVPKSESHKRNIGKAHEGVPRDEETKLRIREARLNPNFREVHSRENHHNWKGGITELRKLIRESTEMYQWKRKVFERDNFCDWFSGLTGFVEAHHIVPFSVIIERNNIRSLNDARNCKELWDVNNGVTMTTANHKAYHDMWGIA